MHATDIGLNVRGGARARDAAHSATKQAAVLGVRVYKRARMLAEKHGLVDMRIGCALVTMRMRMCVVTVVHNQRTFRSVYNGMDTATDNGFAQATKLARFASTIHSNHLE